MTIGADQPLLYSVLSKLQANEQISRALTPRARRACRPSHARVSARSSFRGFGARGARTAGAGPKFLSREGFVTIER